MENYLEDVKSALQSLIVLVWKERSEMTLLIAKKNKTLKELKDNKRMIEFLSQNPDLDDEGLSNLAYWSVRHSVIPDFNENEKSILILQDEIKNKQFSIDLLSSSILQIVKQGLIRIYGDLESCPNGREIKSLHLKEILWYGRNQGIHFEEENLSTKTKTFFDKLKIQYPNKFDDFQTKNMSFRILEVLDWKTLNDIKTDLLSFGNFHGESKP